jgi:hypothetical protein
MDRGIGMETPRSFLLSQMMQGVTAFSAYCTARMRKRRTPNAIR